jgi:hypothetical protein
MELMRLGWGTDEATFRQFFTSQFMPGGSKELWDAFNDLQVRTTSPDNAAHVLEVNGQVDVVGIAPQVTAPALVLHARDDRRPPLEQGRLLASLLPDSTFVVLESSNHILLADEPAWQVFLAEVEASSVAEATASRRRRMTSGRGRGSRRVQALGRLTGCRRRHGRPDDGRTVDPRWVEQAQRPLGLQQPVGRSGVESDPTRQQSRAVVRRQHGRLQAIDAGHRCHCRDGVEEGDAHAATLVLVDDLEGDLRRAGGHPDGAGDAGGAVADRGEPGDVPVPVDGGQHATHAAREAWGADEVARGPRGGREAVEDSLQRLDLVGRERPQRGCPTVPKTGEDRGALLAQR